MKFLSAASLAAFSGLQLLAAAFGPNAHFLCSQDHKIYISEIHQQENRKYYTAAETNEPRGPNGEQYSAHRFTREGLNGETIRYLIQPAMEYPHNRVFDQIEGDWRPCSYHES
ncbi:BgTH12-07690 [Blumeria graminis f. sp. triticale]|uniref:BgTH12-07688 n=1 Tax=Blumeria graminis f. sp. triticale TaxID=1689686 RepID=A0A9W4DDL0_BLUGR|nr:BgTH12-07688 [Blumeria graminis f. sp. triticale]CAD6506462.1 BgTH12-07690 [Blumeria graminis f. sp. triticale]